MRSRLSMNKLRKKNLIFISKNRKQLKNAFSLEIFKLEKIFDENFQHLEKNESPNKPSVLLEAKQNCKSTPLNYVVEVRAVFLKIGDIDTLNAKFYAEAFVEAKWSDPTLDPIVKYDPNLHWNPNLFVLNSLGEPKQQIWHNQYSLNEYQNEEVENDNEKKNINFVNVGRGGTGCVLVERRRITGQFWQMLNLKNFPADVQDLTITITTSKHPNEIELIHYRDKCSSVNIKCFIDKQEWRLYKHVTVNQFLRESFFSSEIFPAIELTINAARRPTFYFLNAFFLIFLITLSSLSVFSIRCHMNQNRIQTTSTLLLTSVTFKWITNRSLPTVSYMTSLDKYSIMSILFLCAQCIWHSIISAVMDLEQKCDQPFSFYDFGAFILFCLMFLLIQFVFIFWLIRNGYSKRRKLNRQEADYCNAVMGKRSTRLKSMLYGI